MIDENNDKVNKANNTKKLIIIIAVIVLGAVAGFIVYKSILSKDNDGSKENGAETEVKKSNDEETLSTHPYMIVVTAKYGATDEYKKFIDDLFGDNAEEKFRVYFQWFNVTHELTHGMITYNSDLNYFVHLLEYKKNGYVEEQHVNDFVVAFWKKYGDPEKVQLLKETVEYVLSKLDDPTDGTMTLEEYGKNLWSQNNPDSSFEEYGWFQFNSVKQAFDKDLSFEEAFSNLGIKTKVNFDEEKLSYPTIDETISDKVIQDVVAKYKKWGLNYPEVYHVYDDDPNTNYSNALTKAEYESLVNNGQ